eukprot:scaffold40283_cov65-Phaeocystis_antarctica.AAC.7
MTSNPDSAVAAAELKTEVATAAVELPPAAPSPADAATGARLAAGGRAGIELLSLTEAQERSTPRERGSTWGRPRPWDTPGTPAPLATCKYTPSSRGGRIVSRLARWPSPSRCCSQRGRRAQASKGCSSRSWVPGRPGRDLRRAERGPSRGPLTLVLLLGPSGASEMNAPSWQS